jgi:integrase
MPKLKLTKASVEALPFTESGQVMYVDTELKGFALVVGRVAKAYIAQKDVRGRTRRITIGRHGTWTTELARKEAQHLLVEMDRGFDPVEKKKAEASDLITFGEAYRIHLERIQRLGRTPRTIETYHERVDRYLRDWLARPIRHISRADIRERHTRIGENHGRTSANRAMAAFRAIYNTVLKEHENFPVAPTIAVHWYKEYRRQAPVADIDLPDWYAKVMQIRNPVRRDLQLFTLFTGLRRNDACTVRWDDVNAALGSLHRPNPKGGPARAFTIPLPDVCVEILARRREENPKMFGEGCPWVFPSLSLHGDKVIPVSEPQEYKRGLPSPHRLRDTYTTAANGAGLSPYDIDVLTNHRPPQGSVTSGYIRQDFSHLKIQQQKVADYLKDKMKWDEAYNLAKFTAPTPRDGRTVGKIRNGLPSGASAA